MKSIFLALTLIALVQGRRNDTNPELPIPVNYCPHWFDIRSEYVANNFINEKYQASMRMPFSHNGNLKQMLHQINKHIEIVLLFLRGSGMSMPSKMSHSLEAQFVVVLPLIGDFYQRRQARQRKVWMSLMWGCSIARR